MTEEHAPRMSSRDYYSCIDRAARARRPDEIRNLRGDVRQRWRGDPRADDLAEALYAHEERLAGRQSPSDADMSEGAASR